MKTADEIIDEFTSRCIPGEAATIFIKLCLANVQYRRIETPHPEAPESVDNKDEETMNVIRAISTLLYEIEKSMAITKQSK